MVLHPNGDFYDPEDFVLAQNTYHSDHTCKVFPLEINIIRDSVLAPSLGARRLCYKQRDTVLDTVRFTLKITKASSGLSRIKEFLYQSRQSSVSFCIKVCRYSKLSRYVFGVMDTFRATLKKAA